jgi:hypothetical protein
VAYTISLYNHTVRRFLDGSNAVGDTFKVRLMSSATFNATHTTLAQTSGTEVANGNGYTTGGATLSGVTVSTVTTNDAMFDANDVTWTASGGSISAVAAILYNATDTDSPPVAFIDFGGTETAGDGTDFKIVWNASGIITARWPDHDIRHHARRA